MKVETLPLFAVDFVVVREAGLNWLMNVLTGEKKLLSSPLRQVNS
jgi:hypothetical protein